MLFCPITRSKLLHFLPKGGEVAEIGVAEGDFSQDIIAAAAPRMLHLIDLWAHQDRDDYLKDPNNVSGETQDARFEGVLARFRNEIELGQVCVHRGYSHEAADLFAHQQFDWIYVDAMHTAQAVYRDLISYHDTVRRGGFIVGHDYTNHVQAQSWNFGVIESVNRFVSEFGYELLALTNEPFPTYVLSNEPDGAAASELKVRLVTEIPYTVEIRGFPGKHPFQHKSIKRENQILVYPSF